jgi:hypothetical protein
MGEYVLRSCCRFHANFAHKGKIGQTIHSDEHGKRSDTRANDNWIHPEAKEKRTMMNSKQRSYTIHIALVVGATFLLVTLVLGVLGQWAIVVTLAVGTIFFGLLVLTGHQLHRTLLEESPLPLTFPGSPPLPLYHPIDLAGRHTGQERIERAEEEFKPFVFKDEEVPAVPERQRLAAEWNFVDERVP